MSREEIIKQFSNTFDSERSEVYQFMESFNGTLEEMYYAYAEYKGIKNVSLLKLIPIRKKKSYTPQKLFNTIKYEKISINKII